MQKQLTVDATLPVDAGDATLVGRVFRPDVAGPALAIVRDGELLDISRGTSTMSALAELDEPARAARGTRGERICTLEQALANTPEATRDRNKPWILAPVDLQALKAAGVTFVASMLERVIEEQARGDASKAESVRRAIVAVIGDDLASIVPGSREAARLKDALIAQKAWSQYLEVGIGPDAEIFTKSAPMSAIGTGMSIGIHPKSEWNNPEPEIVLIIDSRGRVVGATLGNDINLRDFEGRSALLLGKAKDNNASCAVGPFVRLFDAHFGIDDVRRAEIALRVDGSDRFVLEGSSSMAKISRDPLDLVAQAINANHQYPDGFALFLGTMFAPTQDRHGPGQGFTHAVGDIVTISTPKLGALVNRVDHTDAIEPWTFGTRALMQNLAQRRLLTI
ncbi:MAG TPA: fumarylacetoacetate hydrolase family protein [Casimicrobiaceae bacterium]|nr:fumarylacetoacetate hydrolase family protein [Casimicrobiaceae bacterium]